MIYVYLRVEKVYDASRSDALGRESLGHLTKVPGKVANYCYAALPARISKTEDSVASHGSEKTVVNELGTLWLPLGGWQAFGRMADHRL